MLGMRRSLSIRAFSFKKKQSIGGSNSQKSSPLKDEEERNKMSQEWYAYSDVAWFSESVNVGGVEGFIHSLVTVRCTFIR